MWYFKPWLIEIGPVVSKMTCSESGRQKRTELTSAREITANGHNEKAQLEPETCSRLPIG
jgi:hypothetical protein